MPRWQVQLLYELFTSELDSMILVGDFQLRIFCDWQKIGWEDVASLAISKTTGQYGKWKSWHNCNSECSPNAFSVRHPEGWKAEHHQGVSTSDSWTKAGMWGVCRQHAQAAPELQKGRGSLWCGHLVIFLTTGCVFPQGFSLGKLKASKSFGLKTC